MIICEFSFYIQDPKNLDYAMGEVDIYGSIPPGRDKPNHRLSIRKNLKTGEFEAYRHYHKPALKILEGVKESVAFHSSSLEEVVEFTNGEVRRLHGGLLLQDQVCIHHAAKGAEFCDAPRFADSLVCFICGKEYETVGDVQDTRRLSGHLTGKHHLKGDAFFEALGRAELMKIKARKALAVHK